MSFRSFKPKNKEKWEKDTTPVPEKQNTYVAGFGFIPYDAKKEEEKYIKRRSNYLAFSSLVFIIIQYSMYILKPLISEALGLSLLGIWGYIYNLISLFIGLLFTAIIYVILIEIPLKKIIPKGKLDPGMVLSGIGIFLFCSTIGEAASSSMRYVLLNFSIETGPINLYVPKNAMESIFVLIIIYIIPVIFEEFFFQGIILQSLRPIGDGFAILTTALITTFFIGNYTNFISVFLTSLILCYFCIRTNNIFVPIVIRLFGSLIWGWQEQIIGLLGENYQVVKYSVLIIFLLLGFVAILYLIYSRENMLGFENIESTIIYRSNIKKFFTTFSFLIMSLLMIVRMIFVE